MVLYWWVKCLPENCHTGHQKYSHNWYRNLLAAIRSVTGRSQHLLLLPLRSTKFYFQFEWKGKHKKAVACSTGVLSLSILRRSFHCYLSPIHSDETNPFTEDLHSRGLRHLDLLGGFLKLLGGSDRMFHKFFGTVLQAANFFLIQGFCWKIHNTVVKASLYQSAEHEKASG